MQVPAPCLKVKLGRTWAQSELMRSRNAEDIGMYSMWGFPFCIPKDMEFGQAGYPKWLPYHLASTALSTHCAMCTSCMLGYT